MKASKSAARKDCAEEGVELALRIHQEKDSASLEPTEGGDELGRDMATGQNGRVRKRGPFS